MDQFIKKKPVNLPILQNVATSNLMSKEERRITITKPKGHIYVQTTSNNTIITLTDSLGNTKFWASGGTCGFDGSRRSSSLASKTVGEKIGKMALSLGINPVIIYIKGSGIANKKSAVKGIARKGLNITKIQDTTSIPHNGCRAPKKRRI